MSSDRGRLKDRVVGGALWNVLTQLTVQGTKLVVAVVLARLLTPRQFGVAGMAFVFANLLGLFTDLSFGAALIQRQELTEHDRSTIFWTTLAFGLGCTTLGVGLSGLIAGFFGVPQVGPLFAALSIGFTLTALSSTQYALTMRALEYRRLQIREMVATIVGGGVGVAVAVAGLGAWAIVCQYLAMDAAAAALIWTLSPWRPHFLFSRASLRDLGGFGVKLFGTRLLSYANLNADNLLVSRFLGSRALGIYSLSYSVMFTPILRIEAPIQQVVFPAYARLQSDPKRLGAAWLRSKRMSSALLAPLFFATMVIAPDLVPVVFGAKWRDAVPVMQLLCVAGIANAVVTLNWSVLQARGLAGTLFRLNLFMTSVVIASFALGLIWGIIGVAACYAAAKVLLVIPEMWVTAGSVSMGLGRALWAGMTAVFGAGAAALLAYGFRLLLVAGGISAPARLALVLIFDAAAYITLVALTSPDLVREVRGLRTSIFRGRGLRSAPEGASG